MTKKLSDIETLGIVAINSIEYIHYVFDSLRNGTCVVPLQSESDTFRLNATYTTDIITPNNSKGWFQIDDYEIENINPESIAQISFTSGTEGHPKGVLLSFQALEDVVNRLKNISSVNASLREYIAVPVYHSFGYARCRLIARVRGKGYIPTDGFNPNEISQLLISNQINSLSAVPTMLRVLLSVKNIFGEERNKLLWIEIGSQPMSSEEKHELLELFPNAQMIQHYGLTEASRTTILDLRAEQNNHLGSVGKASGSTEIKLSSKGEILIKGRHVTMGYIQDGKVVSALNDDGWFETNDLGEIDNGYLYFKGRVDNLINCAGQKISSEYIESQIKKLTDMKHGFAVTRIPHEVYGEAVLVCLEQEFTNNMQLVKQTVLEILKSQGIELNSLIHLYTIDKIPLTDTGKTQYKKILNKYQTEHLENNVKNVDDDLHPIHKLFLTHFDDVCYEKTSFQSKGGDSLLAVKFSMELESIFHNVPTYWREQTILDLIKLDSSEINHKVSDKKITYDPNYILGSENRNPTGLGFWALIKEDYETHEKKLTSQGFWAIFNNRFGNMRMGIKPKLLRMPLTLIYRVQTKVIQWVCGIKLDYTVQLGRRVKLEHFGGMILGARYIGDDVTIRQNTTFGIKDLSNLDSKPIIEKGVNIGAGAVIVGDVTVGRHSVIGPNVVIDSDLAPFSVVQTPNNIIHNNK